tara:strand:- start:6 stop:221 length:216 start_codon:yes stop_codon:yes gene_type:complete
MTKECNICKKQFKGFGNNPDPVRLWGVCCDTCDMGVVIPARRLFDHYVNKLGHKEGWLKFQKLVNPSFFKS